MAEQSEEVTVSLTNDKVRFSGVSKSNPDAPIVFDYRPPIGDGQGFNGLELLLMSLAGCSGTAVAYLLRKMSKTVSGLKVNAKGIRRDQPPMGFERIYLEFLLSSGDANDADIQRAMQLAEDQLCPVWQMVKNSVEVVSSYKVDSRFPS